MSTVFSIDPVGTTKACSSVLVPNSRIRMVTAHSAKKLRASGFVSAVSSFFRFSAGLTGLLLGTVAMDELECPTPSRLAEKMLRQIDNVIDANARVRQAICGRVV